MAGFIEATVQDIDARLAELEREQQRLLAARSALTSEVAASAAAAESPRAGGRAARAGGRRAAAGSASAGSSRRAAAPARGTRKTTRRSTGSGKTRAAQAQALVTQRPGITIPEIAAELKIQPNYLYRVLGGLAQSGQVKRVDQGWHPVTDDAAATSAQ